MLSTTAIGIPHFEQHDTAHQAGSRKNRPLESTKHSKPETNVGGSRSTVYTAEIVPTMDARAARFRAHFERRSKAMVYAITQIDALFPYNDNCDVAAELWTCGSVELPGYSVRIQARLCNCLPSSVCSFCDWRERANRVRMVRTPSRSLGVLVPIRDGPDKTEAEE